MVPSVKSVGAACLFPPGASLDRARVSVGRDRAARKGLGLLPVGRRISTALAGKDKTGTIPRNFAAPRAASLGGEESEVGSSAPWDVLRWEWRNGWTINYAVTGAGPPVVLVHGFGANLGQFRRTIPALASAGYRVYAIDLLGFGGSSKPTDLDFNMRVWRDQVVDFVQEVVQSEARQGEGRDAVVLVGNSIGSLASLMANAALPDSAVRGTVLLNCAAGMNNKAVVGDWRIALARPLFILVDLVLKSPLGKVIFERVREKAILRGALEQIYSFKESVDEELVDLFHGPSCDEGAADVFISIYTGNDAGPTPPEVVPQVHGPILVLWGEDDVLTPLDGPGGNYFAGLPALRPDTVFETLPGCGHCPHDDRPDVVHSKLLPWLAALEPQPESVATGRGREYL